MRSFAWPCHKFRGSAPLEVETRALDADDIASLYRAQARALVAYFARRTFDAHAATELMAETFAAAVADRRSSAATTRARGSTASPAISSSSGTGGRGGAARTRRLGLDPPGLSDDEYERIEELSGLEALRGIRGAAVSGLPENHQALRMRVVEEARLPRGRGGARDREQAARARVRVRCEGWPRRWRASTSDDLPELTACGEALVDRVRGDELGGARARGGSAKRSLPGRVGGCAPACARWPRRSRWHFRSPRRAERATALVLKTADVGA